MTIGCIQHGKCALMPDHGVVTFGGNRSEGRSGLGNGAAAKLATPALRAGRGVEPEHGAVDPRHDDRIADDRDAAAHLDRRRGAPLDPAGDKIERDDTTGVAIREIGDGDEHDAVRDRRRRR